jgi:acyl carrier protein
MEDLVEALKDILEVDELVLSAELSTYEMWDSLSALSLIAFVEERYSIVVGADDLAQMKTVSGVIEFIANKLATK